MAGPLCRESVRRHFGPIKSNHKTDFVVGYSRRLFAMPYTTENFTSCLVKLAAKFFETFAFDEIFGQKAAFFPELTFRDLP